MCHFSGGESPTEGTYDRFLASGEKPSINAILYHGPIIPDWRNDKLPVTYRKASATTMVIFNLDGDEVIGEPVNPIEFLEVLHRHNQLRDRPDALSQITYQMRALELGRDVPHPEGLPTFTRQDMEFLELTHDIKKYRAIFDHWARAINGTKEIARDYEDEATP